MTEEIADMKKRLLSFRAFADGATPEVLVTLIQTLVERIYIVYDNEIAICIPEDFFLFQRRKNTGPTGAVKS